MDAVITVPSRYGKNQREAILDACRGARLNVLELLKSPTAAAIAYSLTNRNRTRRHVLVCDMGGSYFDFALLSVEDGCIFERAIGTDYVNLDDCIVKFCMQDLRDKFSINIAGQQLAIQRLRRTCELAKRKLSQYNQARIEITSIKDGVDYVCNLSRLHFEELCREDIEPLLDPISWCLEDTGLDKADVNEVVLVGGAARIPSIRRAIREFFYGKVPREVLRPDHAAVLGVAAYAAVLAGRSEQSVPEELKHIQVHQVTPWSTVPVEGERSNGHEREKDSIKTGLQEFVARSQTIEDLENPELIPSDGVVNCPNKTKAPRKFAEASTSGYRTAL